MSNFLLKLKNSYGLVFLAILVGFVLQYLDSKFYSKEYEKSDYIKLALLIGGISTFIVFVHKMNGKIDDEILSGPAPF